MTTSLALVCSAGRSSPSCIA